MSPIVAVSDASPLIALHQISRLDLLQSQFDAVVVPPTVVREVAPLVGELPTWVQTARPHLQAGGHLDPGEHEAISLAVHLSADVLIIDDFRGAEQQRRSVFVSSDRSVSSFEPNSANSSVRCDRRWMR